MDRRIIEEHLAQAERHVALGERNIAKQRTILAELERDGHVEAAAQARELLKQFEGLQTLHVSDRDRLRGELAEIRTHRPDSC